MFICARQKCVCAASIWKFCMRAWKTHLRGISCVMHNYNNFKAQTELVAGPKKIPIGFQTVQAKKNGARKDFWRLTPSKWPPIQNMGSAKPNNFWKPIKVKQQIWIIGITKPRSTNVSMLKLMHQKADYSYINCWEQWYPQFLICKCIYQKTSGIWEVGAGHWECMQDSIFEVAGEPVPFES